MNRIVVGAHYGLKDWLAQRITAVVMAVFTILVAVAVLSGAASGYDSWRAFIGNGLVRFLAFLFVISLCYHAWIGVRDIWMDYVKPTAVRVTLHVLTLLVLVGCAGWATQVLWRL
ncbi:MAG: succinate dehydrogenase, hydrophobic membrane anchor protein [Rhodocyclaceae bacterium]|nr:succinate dehydrogenase, hydrophobic membrane anchor protein [Rhodocyclaceae bacterium]